VIRAVIPAKPHPARAGSRQSDCCVLALPRIGASSESGMPEIGGVAPVAFPWPL